MACRGSWHCRFSCRRPPLLLVLAAAAAVVLNTRGTRLPHVSLAWKARGGRAYAARGLCCLCHGRKASAAAATVVKVTRWGRPPHACWVLDGCGRRDSDVRQPRLLVVLAAAAAVCMVASSGRPPHMSWVGRVRQLRVRCAAAVLAWRGSRHAEGG